MSAPPITASSQSRTKLRAFQYAAKGEGPTEKELNTGNEDQENKYAKEARKSKDSQKPLSSSFHESHDLQNIVQTAFPATPVGRVPLAELISNTEDTLDQLPLLTPVERVLWNHSPSSTDLVGTFATPFTRRGTKRARSSSPKSSSREEEAGLLVSPGRRAPFDTQTLQKSLTSPQADPATELWSRYSLHPASKQTPSKAPALSPTNLFHTLSPQTPARYVNGLDNSGLRRSLSCGMEWPTSAAKRRKIQKSLSQIADRNVAISCDETPNPYHDIKVSRVKFLLGKIHDGLAENCAKAKVALPSSSSPPLLAGNQYRATASSPIEQPQDDVAQVSPSGARKGLSSAEHTRPHEAWENVEQSQEETMVIKENLSSDYGDDDFDEGLLYEVDATMCTTAPPGNVAGTLLGAHVAQNSGPENKSVNSLSNSTDHVRSGAGMEVSIGGLCTGMTILPHISISQEEEHKSISQRDEFDDEYDELVGEGLVSLAADFDQQLPPDAALKISTSKLPAHDLPTKEQLTANGLSKREEVVDLISDDEFGDGFEFEDIAEDYARATQAIDTSSASLVRRFHLKPST